MAICKVLSPLVGELDMSYKMSLDCLRVDKVGRFNYKSVGACGRVRIA